MKSFSLPFFFKYEILFLCFQKTLELPLISPSGTMLQLQVEIG